MAVKAGYKGAAWYGTDYKIASGSWTYGGETRNMQDIDQFSDAVVEQLPLQIVGGDITISGNYLLAEDQGLKQLKIDFDLGTKITNLRLYTDYDGGAGAYMTPDATGLNGAQSHVIVTNVNNVGDDKSGVGTITATLHVNGMLEQKNSTSAVNVETLGEINNVYGAGNSGQCEFWGKLVNRGDGSNEAADIECYFEWGLTPTFGDSDYVTEHTFVSPDKGEYEGTTPGDLITDVPTLYYYRAVALLDDSSRVYGETMTFTTLDS